MGIITVEKADHLFWLGRYAERVYELINVYSRGYDVLIDLEEGYYKKLCERLDIPNIYKSSEDFIQRYAYDSEDPNSIISNLNRAYDNALVMRDEIGTETMAYIQMAVYDLEAAALNKAPMIRLQKAIDNLFAFWGCVEDQIDNLQMRGIMQFGHRIERLDMGLRLNRERDDLRRCFNRMIIPLYDSALKYNEEALNELNEILFDDEKPIDNKAALRCLYRIMYV